MPDQSEPPTSPENIIYWLKGQSKQNFGDFLTELFLEEVFLAPRVYAAGYRLVGSAIHDEMIRDDLALVGAQPSGKLAYWACGMREERCLKTYFRVRCAFFGVRGPLTRDLLDLPETTPLGDPGLLLPLLHRPAKSPMTSGRAVCVPHFDDLRHDSEILASTGADLVVRPAIDNTIEALKFCVDAIASAGFVLAGSLHSAIVACAYDVPFAYWDSGAIDIPFKWKDFAASVGIPASFVTDVRQGRVIYDEFVDKIRKPPLFPILANAPFHVRPSLLVRAAISDGFVTGEMDPNLLRFLESSNVERVGRTELDTQLSAIHTLNEPSARTVALIKNELGAAKADLSGTINALNTALMNEIGAMRAEMERETFASKEVILGLRRDMSEATDTLATAISEELAELNPATQAWASNIKPEIVDQIVPAVAAVRSDFVERQDTLGTRLRVGFGIVTALQLAILALLALHRL